MNRHSEATTKKSGVVDRIAGKIVVVQALVSCCVVASGIVSALAASHPASLQALHRAPALSSSEQQPGSPSPRLLRRLRQHALHVGASRALFSPEPRSCRRPKVQICRVAFRVDRWGENSVTGKISIACNIFHCKCPFSVTV
jgi:hypothetical protein